MRNIDERLDSDGQRTIARLVAGLENESPSMVWRSGLNEALRVESCRVQRRRRFFFVARPMLGLAAACALAFVVFIHPQTSEPKPVSTANQIVASNQQPSVEAALVNLHIDDSRAMDVAGVGLNPDDTSSDQDTVSNSANNDDSEADLEY